MEEHQKAMRSVIVGTGVIPTRSVHLWLREAFRTLDKGFYGAPFCEAASLAGDMNLPLIEGWENGTAIHRRFKLADSVFQFNDGKMADAYIFFSSLNKTDGKLPVIPTEIYHASIGLLIDVGHPYESVVKREIFPTDTAMSKSLSLQEVVRSGARWPCLDRILISYCVLANRWIEENPSGFSLEIDFVASRKKEIGRESIRCNIPSGLDPRKDWNGNPTEKNHKPEDTLGEPSYHGGIEGWHGQPFEIAINKAFYLRCNLSI